MSVSDGWMTDKGVVGEVLRPLSGLGGEVDFPRDEEFALVKAVTLYRRVNSNEMSKSNNILLKKRREHKR